MFLLSKHVHDLKYSTKPSIQKLYSTSDDKIHFKNYLNFGSLREKHKTLSTCVTSLDSCTLTSVVAILLVVLIPFISFYPTNDRFQNRNHEMTICSWYLISNRSFSNLGEDLILVQWDTSRQL